MSPLPLAAVDALNTYKEGLYGESDPGITRKIILGTAVIAAFWLALYFWDRYQRRLRAAAAAAANSLWGELSAAHGLTAAERRSLEDLSAQAGLQPPESIFAMPDVLQAQAAANPADGLWPKLLTKLFGDDLEPAAATNAATA